MAAGTWTAQNKVRPGVYSNFSSVPTTIGTIGERGIVSLPLVLPWGEPQTVTALASGEDTLGKFGYNLTDTAMLLIREAMKQAQTLLIYRVNTGAKATITAGNLTATAKWGGVRGNDLTVVITENVDNEEWFDVSTLLGGEEVDIQTVANIAGLTANDWIVWSGTGDLAESSGARLINGANGTATTQNYLDYQEAIEVNDFNVIGLPVTDSEVKAAFVDFCKRMRDTEGKKIQIVMENYPVADYEGIISVKNGVVLADGTALTAAQCTAWVAGATAGAQLNESLTYTAYDGAIDVGTRYTNSQIIAALQAGEFLFTPGDNQAKVEQDINTFTSITVTKGKAFSKNRVIRVIDGINNDYVQIFSDFYIGKINNNADGRNLLKNECVNYIQALQDIEAVQNFDSQADITIEAGEDADSAYIEITIQPVDAVEKIYVKVRLN